MRGNIFKRGKKYNVILSYGRDSNGKRKQKWYSGYNTKKEAEIAMTKLLNEFDNGFIQEDRNIIVSDYLLDWLKTYGKYNLKETTISGYSSYITNHINPYIGHIKLHELQPLTLQKHYNYLLSEGRCDGNGGLSAKSVLQVHRILSKAFGQAYKLQMIPRNPTEYVEIPRKKKYKVNIINENDIQTLLEGALDTDIYIPILLAINLGLRRGEVLGLMWKNIDFDNAVLSVENALVSTNNGIILTSPKSEDSVRTLMISQRLVEKLKKHKADQEIFKSCLANEYIDNDIVCCKYNGGYMHPRRLNQKFSDLLNKLKIPHIRFHDLRHINATLMLKANIPAKIASERLGHSSIGITLDIYSHVITEMQEEAVKSLDEVIFIQK